MSNLKALLKSARQALNDKENEKCISQCTEILEQDPKSYNALVFLGLANSNLGNFAEGQKSYDQAIGIDSTNLLAWQGLLALLEKSGDVSRYIDTASRIAAIYAESSEEDKCFQVIDKAINYAKQFGTPTNVAQSLSLILPVSPFFRLLEDKIAPAAETYVELAAILEEEEASKISAAIAKGRTRLGVKLDQLTKDVKIEVYSSSQLESIYGEIINWSLEEAVRREAETKLLARVVDRLQAARTSEKAALLGRVMSIAKGMTIVKVPNYLAWSIALNWTDFYLCQINIEQILNFSNLFSEDLAATALKSFLWSAKSPIDSEALSHFVPEEKDGKPQPKLDIDNVIAALVDVQENSSKDSFLLCLRALLYLYDVTEDWSSTIATAESCLEQIKLIETSTSTKLHMIELECRYYLAHAMVQYRAPKYHDQALEAFNIVIDSGSDVLESQAAIGKARILRHQGAVAESRKLLQGVLKRKSDGYSAQLELAECDISDHEYNSALDTLQKLASNLSAEGARSTLASIHYLIGICHEALKHDTGDMYAAYIQSLRYDSNYAPTYTALGVYYADEVNDPLRAEKCFQKALELSPAELRSAHRLAAVFADDGDWELVEIIAQRVIQGNERLTVSWPYRALGFVHLNTGKHAEAVSSFQSGLRLATKDVDAWIGLGEAYFELGRYTAAEKAFGRASMLDPENWYARYLTANVATALGEHHSACSILESMLGSDPSPSVRSSLGAAYMSWVKALLANGWVSKAMLIAEKALSVAQQLTAESRSPFAYNLIGQSAMTLATYTKDTGKEVDAIIQKIADSLSDSDLVHSLLDASLPETSESRLGMIALRSFVFCIEEQSLKDEEEAAIWSNVANALQILASTAADDAQYTTAAVKAMQCAVKLDPRNDLYWSGLGVLTSANDLAFSQHCLIKATSLNGKSARHWTNLGYFYLKQHHQEAANQAFLKAQRLEPSSSLAWLGQACIAHDMGEPDHELFEHAMRLGSAFPAPLTAVKYAESVLRMPAEKSSTTTLSTATFVLDQALKQPNSADHRRSLQYYRLLMLERQSFSEALIDAADGLASDLESAYETDESDATLSRYCDAKAVLARLYVRAGQYAEALETATSVLELEPSNAPESIISCTLVAGIAQCLVGELAEAISTLQGLYETDVDNEQYLRVLVQVLIMNDGDEESSDLALELLSGKHSDAASKLLLVAVMTARPSTTDKQQALAQSLLNDLLSYSDPIVRRVRDLLERKLIGQGILHSQVHHDPNNCKTWLALSQASKNKEEKEVAMHMALLYAKRGTNLDDLAAVCRLSADPADRAISLHLAPHMY